MSALDPSASVAMPPSSYTAFLEDKARLAPHGGFMVSADEVAPTLKDHVRLAVPWAAAGGRRALFWKFGLAKTSAQLELMRLARRHAGGETLIILPLGVRHEFMREARERFVGDHAISTRFIRSPAEMDGETDVYLTNYETVRDGKLDPNLFTAVSLDEASVLRSFGSKTYQTFLDLFEAVKYRFVATATPAPNRFKEIIHYAGFLGVMDTGQALTRFFQRNSEKAGDLTLYPHKEREFWLWVASWALFLETPADLGCSDAGYELPALNVRWHEVETDPTTDAVDRDGQRLLIRDPARGLANEAKARRSALQVCVDRATEIVAADPDSHRIIWHDLEDERRAIAATIPDVVSVYGSQDLDERETKIIGFSDGEVKLLSTKPIIAGSGCNFQRHCHKAIFIGVGHKFNDFIQAVHRIHRFGQTRPVEIDIVYPDSLREARRDLEAKWARYDEMSASMRDVIRAHGLSQAAMRSSMTRSIGCERRELSGVGWHVANNDCVEETRGMDDESVDLIVTSIPFSNHYEYTPSYNDFGHTDDDVHFFAQMDYLTPELLRILKPGRLACIHVKDRILFGSVTGYGCPTVNPFHAKTLFHYQRHGFVFLGMVTVVTDVVRENNQTYRLGYTEMLKDGTKMGVGSPEYVLLMRKLPSDRSRSYADDRVVRQLDDYSLARWQIDAHAFWRSDGRHLLNVEEMSAMHPNELATAFTLQSLERPYSYEDHVAIGEALGARRRLPTEFMAVAPGSPDPDVWHDVVRMRTLNTIQAQAGREKHICPFQLDIVERLIRRYSNKGDLVFDPFGGLFTVPYQALALGRRGRAVELNESYFRDGVRHLEAKERALATPSLFDDGEAAE